MRRRRPLHLWNVASSNGRQKSWLGDQERGLPRQRVPLQAADNKLTFVNCPEMGQGCLRFCKAVRTIGENGPDRCAARRVSSPSRRSPGRRGPASQYTMWRFLRGYPWLASRPGPPAGVCLAKLSAGLAVPCMSGGFRPPRKCRYAGNSRRKGPLFRVPSWRNAAGAGRRSDLKSCAARTDLFRSGMS